MRAVLAISIGFAGWGCAQHAGKFDPERSVREPCPAEANEPGSPEEPIESGRHEVPRVRQAGKRISVERVCADSDTVFVEREIGVSAAGYTSAARPVPEGGLVRLIKQHIIETSLDGGKTWTKTLDPVPMGPRWLALDGRGTVWAANTKQVWSSEDGLSWHEVTIPRRFVRTGGLYNGLLVHAGSVWVADLESRTLIRPSMGEPSMSWGRMVVPASGRIHSVASNGENFLAIGEIRGKTIAVDFGGKGAQTAPTGLGFGGALECADSTCVALLGGELALRDGPDTAWEQLGDPWELSRWYVANCDTSSLGDVADVVKRSEGKPFYSIWGMGFDGSSVALAASVSVDNDVYRALALIVGASGIRLFPFGYGGVWVKEAGGFWFFGPGIHVVKVNS